MPHGKSGQQSTRKNPREESSKEDEFELEVDPTAREDTLSPLYSASTAGSVSASSAVSSSQLEMILAANSKILADSMASNQRSMEASFLSALSTISTPGSVAPSVASAPPPAVAPRTQVKVPIWSDAESPTTYFSKLEKAFTLNGLPRSQWGQSVHVHLTGEAQDALAQVPLVSLEDYDVIKATVLDALGDTPEFADRGWWSLSRKSGEDACAFYLRIRACGILRLQGLTSKDEILEKLVLSRFLSLLPADSYAHATDRSPKDGLEAAKIVQQLEQRRAYTREKQGWRHQQSGRREHSRGSSSYGGGGNSGSQGSNSHGSRSHSPTQSGSSNSSSGNGGGNTSSGSGVKEVTGGNSSAGAPASGGSKYSGGKNDRGSRKPVICHNCNEPGHIRPNCPNRVRSVRSPEHDQLIIVDGVLAGEFVSGLQIDSGACRSVVDARLVPKSAYLKTSIVLDSWRGKQLSKHRLAKLKITVGKVSVNAVVAVAEELGCPALLGLDLGDEMNENLAGIVFNKAKAARAARSKDVVSNPVVSEAEVSMQIGDSVIVEVPMHVEQVSVTRAQAKKAAAEDKENDLASTQSECEPVALSDVLDFPDSYFEPDEVYDTAVTSLDQVEEVAIPLPELTGDVVKLSDEQKNDETLRVVWKKGVDAEKGYTFEHGVLVHHSSDGFDDTVVRVVVPKSRRLKVLQMGHSTPIAGHFGVKKTHAKIASHFIWPGLWSEVKQYVKTCNGCQLAARQHKSKAPLQPLPCVGEPFQKVAFDLVGPLPRTSSGYKYLLTAMCLYTKFLVAIPLKRVDNLTVLDALMEIFSLYGFPMELLTDQGSVFTSHLTRLMCETFGIKKIQTSPYHPQSDGALERWHACLKGMIKRSGGKLSEWDQQLKYILFAYRDTPHCVTGYSPFSLMFGRDVRGPLHFLKTSWVEGDVDVCKVGDWLVSVKAKMGEISELVSDREAKAKASMKLHYDKSASVKCFKVGDMVLMRKPVRKKKMDCAWQGPFEVEKVVSPVTYALKLPGRSCKPKIVHCNLLKIWHTPAEALHRVMVIGEEESACEASPGLKLGRSDFVPSAAEQLLLDSVLTKHRDVLSDEPGRTEAALLHIRTGDSQPVRGHAYPVPPRWKEQVKTQLDQLLALGIIEPSSSPWSSSMVIVKKKDGGVRTCIDYRAVNAVTDPDPYQMPLIEEILDMLATAHFISKVDLTKGFHQIPINPGDCPKTSFCTPWGKYQFKYMPFGLRNGPAVFQRLMDQILHQDKEYSQVYIDDIAIFSNTWEEHCIHIDVILSRLKEAGLTAKASKCQWGQTQVEFLGHLVGLGRVSPAKLKVSAVADFQFPTTKKGVRQFLGLTGYYRRFIPEFAKHSFHLTEATRKTAPDRVIFSDVLNIEFLYLKSVLCSVPTLTLPVISDSFILQTDASGVGLGAVLSVLREEVEYPVAFFSKKLLPRERKYSASELEGLAVVAAVLHFEAYLITHPFTVVTDHRALTFLHTAHHQNNRLARWAMKLQPFTFDIRYRPGSQHVNADVLSRMFLEDPPSRMPEAPAAYEGTLPLPVSPTDEGGGDVMESPTLAAAAHNI